jgi:hypothetical protein
MRLAGKNKRRYFLEKAKDWFENADSAIFFGDVKTIAIRAVAEYMANQEGFTIYTRLPGK